MELFDAHQYHWWFVIRAIHIKSRDRISINVAKTHEYKLRNYVWSRFLVMNIFDGLLNVKSTKAITYFPCISVQLIRAPSPQLTCNYSIGNILWDWVIFTLHTIHPMFYVSVDMEREREHVGGNTNSQLCQFHQTWLSRCAHSAKQMAELVCASNRAVPDITQNSQNRR